jgi:excisionase family DNA binding protein
VGNLIKIDRVAEIFDVTIPTVRWWVHTRQIPHIKVGRHVRFDLGALDAWLKSNSRQAA